MRFCRVVLVTALVIAAGLVGVLVYRAPLVTALATGLIVRWKVKKPTKRDSLGTASWATTEDLAKAGMLSPGSGLVIGRVRGIRPKFWPSVKGLLNPRITAAELLDSFVLSLKKVQPRRSNKTVRLNDSIHVSVFAPTWAGKGVSIVIPFMLDCMDSIVVIDPKGEIYKLTAEHRRSLGHRIIRLDPFGACGSGSDNFNPLDGIDSSSPFALDDCRDLAASLVLRSGDERDLHWNDSAELIIAALCAACCLYAQGADRNIQSVRMLLTDPARMAAMIALMAAEKGWGGMIARLGNQLSSFKDKELLSVLSTINRHLSFLDTLAVAANTRASTFDPAILRREKVTIYLIMPPERMASQAALMRT